VKGARRRPPPGVSAPAALAVLLVVAVHVHAAEETDGVLEYLYVAANAGEASGGHVALRFGPHVYHFQHEEPGTLQLQRDDARTFDYAYRVLGNRTITASRVAVSGETYARLKQAFNERYVRENRELATRDALRRDRQLLDALAAAREQGAAGPTLDVVGAGLFEMPSRGSAAEPCENGLAVGEPDGGAVARLSGHVPALLALQARVVREYGPNFIASRRQSVVRELAELRYFPNPAACTAEAPAHYAFADRHADLVLQRLALDVLTTAPPLAEGAAIVVPANLVVLDPPAQEVLRRAAHQQEDRLARLLAGRRPDWGGAALIGMARLAALDAAQRCGRLVVLDVAPSAHERTVSAPDLNAAVLEDARAELWEVWQRTRSMGTVEEERLAALELAVSRWHAAEHALATGTLPPAIPDASLPQRPAAVVVPDVALADGALARARERAREEERRYDTWLQKRHGYHLVTRNCVSEIFRTVDAALAAHQGESGLGTRDLGGRIDPDGPLHFVPLVSARVVNATWPVTDVREFPSYRRQRLRAMRTQEGRLRTWLREFNTFTSTVYRWSDDPEFFVFFTDDAILPRPLLGAVNLLAGLGQGVLGVAMAPGDRGRMLRAGLMGALFSLPELTFVNVRKGTLAYVRRGTVIGLGSAEDNEKDDARDDTEQEAEDDDDLARRVVTAPAAADINSGFVEVGLREYN
jgi:hypothetical protein